MAIGEMLVFVDSHVDFGSKGKMLVIGLREAWVYNTR